MKLKNKELLIAFGNHLRKLRVEKGFSMRKLADVANIDYTQVVKIETAKMNTSLVTLSALASALGVPFIKLFDFKIPSYPKPASKRK